MGSTPLSVGIKMALWAIATKKGGKWHWGVFEVADHFMVRWHEEEGEKSWLLYAAENVKSGGKGKGGGSRGGEGRGSRADATVDDREQGKAPGSTGRDGNLRHIAASRTNMLHRSYFFPSFLLMHSAPSFSSPPVFLEAMPRLCSVFFSACSSRRLPWLVLLG